MITNEEKILVGTLTDGDIRRGLINGLDLSDIITDIVNWQPLVARLSWKSDMVLQVMRSNTIKQIPIIDDDGRPSGLYSLDDFLVSPERSNLMIIMAGGRGERMLQHTDKVPKPLLQSAASRCLSISSSVRPKMVLRTLLLLRII